MMKVIFLILIFLLISVFIVNWLYEETLMPSLDKFILFNILKWKEVNILGKVFVILITLPALILDFIIAGVQFIFTWHPRKKD